MDDDFGWSHKNGDLADIEVVQGHLKLEFAVVLLCFQRWPAEYFTLRLEPILNLSARFAATRLE